MPSRRMIILNLIALVAVCAIVTWICVWAASEPIIDVPADASQIARMTYELDVAPKVQERWGKELNQTERRIRGTVDPEYYPLVLACLIKERKVNHEKEGWTMWVYLGTIEIDLKDSRRQEISLWCTYKDTGAFSVNDGKHSTEYRGGNDLLFTNTLIGIHLVQKEKGK